MTPPAKLELRFLGGLSIQQDGAPLAELKSHKGKALLCYLAVTGQNFSRSSLAGLLWSDMPEKSALMNLRKTLSRIKPLSPYLLTTRKTLAFNKDTAHWLDVAEFERLAETTPTLSNLQDAVALYQDDFLAGFVTDGGLLFEEWVLAQRARLRETALRSLHMLVTGFIEQHDFSTAITYARQLLRLEPYQEGMHRELMRLLALSGERAAALRQYEICHRILVDELGIEPSLSTTQLYQKIVADQIAKHRPGTPTHIQKSKHPPHNLPAQTSPFVGRDSELKKLDQYVADPAVRLMTILGPGGIGKTRLALAAAAKQLNQTQEQHRFPHGVYFVSLARLESPKLLVPTLAEAIELRFDERSDSQGQLLRYLRQKKMFLILDNFEHLLDAAGLIDEILQAAPGITILVTSRSKLNRQSEHLLPIRGLTYPPGGAAVDEKLLADWSSYSALQLFRQCARRIQPDFILTTTNLSAVIDVCRMVDGMPLGIVLAASWLDTLSPLGIVKEIQRDLDFLAVDMRDSPKRQRSLRAAFNHSWQLLGEREQEIFRQLSIFRGGFTREAAKAITGAQLRDLQALVNKSLLTLTPGSRYEIHELLRQFAAERLANSPEEERSVRDRHSHNYCDFLHQQAENWHTARQLDTLNEVTTEADNMQLAWQWALEHDEWRWLSQAMDSWSWYHDWRGRFTEGESFCQAVIHKIEGLQADGELISAERLRLWAKALTWQGRFSMAIEIALRRLQQGLALLAREELGDHDIRFEQALAHLAIGEKCYSLDRQRARQHYNKSLALFRELDSAWGIAEGLTDLGLLDWATGDYPSALARTQASLAMNQERGDLRGEVRSMDTLAWIHQHLGHLEEAERLRRKVIDLCQQLEERSSLVLYLADLSITLIWQGKFEESLKWAEKGLTLCMEDSRSDMEGYARLAIGMSLLFSGQYERARRELESALMLVREANALDEEATIHWLLGRLAMAEKAYDEAQKAIEESLRLYEEVQDNLIGLAINGLGIVACLKKELSLARKHFIEGLAYALKLKDFMQLMVALPGAALYLARTNQVERAVEVWSMVQCPPFVANSQWHEDVIGQEITVVNLPPDIVAKARKQGQSQDLWATAEQLLAELS